MAALKDRRYMDRISIPGSTLYYRSEGKSLLLNNYHGPVQIVDLCKSSISIAGKLHRRTTRCLQIKINIPDYSPLKLKGQILGCIKDPMGNIRKTIIQILPFGYQAQYNSFKNKKRLLQLLKR